MNESELMLLLQSNPDFACSVSDMIPQVKKAYVDSKHGLAIKRMNSSNKYRDGHYITHIYVDGKRKAVEKSSEEELYDFLFNHYRSLDERFKTFEDVFEMFVSDKRAHAISELSIRDYRRYIGYLDPRIKKKQLCNITEDELRVWLVNDYLKRRPKKEGLKKMLQTIGMVFKFGIRKKLCIDNPISYIHADEYYKMCDLTTKTNEEKSFSEEDIRKLREYALGKTTNPHAVMMLIAMETGMRAGELAALKKIDVEGDIIHIHRQQTKVPKTPDSNQQVFVDVNYTKNERQNPQGGRPMPITEECQKAIDLAMQLPGESEYLIHHPDGKPVQKDSYIRYLRRVCKRLEITITNNHAFRVAFNARLIAAGVDGNERCLILGHSMQTNERHYSFSDKRRVEDVKNKLKAVI